MEQEKKIFQNFLKEGNIDEGFYNHMIEGLDLINDFNTIDYE